MQIPKESGNGDGWSPVRLRPSDGFLSLFGSTFEIGDVKAEKTVLESTREHF